MGKENTKNPDDRQTQVNVVVKSKRDIPINVIILLVCCGFAFYGGFKTGSISLQTLRNTSEQTIESYKEAINTANDHNNELQNELDRRLEQIKEEQQHLIEQAKRNNENSLKNVIKYEQLISATMSEISKIKNSMIGHQETEKNTQDNELKSLEAKLEIYRTNRLVNVCKNVPIREITIE